MKWPLQIELPDNEPVEGSAFGEHITMTRSGDSVALALGEESWSVGLPTGAKRVRLGPALGPLPFLVFLQPTVIVPAGSEFALEVDIPLHLDLATESVRLRTFAPAGSTRALYGPVDDGTLCWSVHPDVTTSAELRIAGSAQMLSARVAILCQNETTEAVEVRRIMVPTELVGLYAVGDRLQLSDVTMAIIGDAEAELTMEPASGGSALDDVLGRPIAPVRRTFAFSLAYRNRTGLDYGF